MCKKKAFCFHEYTRFFTYETVTLKVIRQGNGRYVINEKRSTVEDGVIRNEPIGQLDFDTLGQAEAAFFKLVSDNSL